MIISRTPFRVSFFGGGTDYPAWYREHGGAVLSTAINKYCYITCRYLPPFQDYKYLIRYYKREETRTLEEIQHPSVRESLRFMELENGVDIVHHADLPARSGLGSSSTFTVGLLHALYALKHEMPTKRQLAINAIRVEQELIGEHVGSQDQTAAAFGGLNRIEFGGVNEIAVTPLIIQPERLDRLQNYLMLFFTGFSRTASEVAKEQIAQIPKRAAELRDMVGLVGEAESLLTSKEDRLEDFGRLLDEQWRIKRRLSDRVSTDRIDAMYDTALGAGALGGKLLGAVLDNLLFVPMRFDNLGSQIIYYSHEDQQ